MSSNYSVNDVAGEVTTLKFSTNKSLKECLVAAANAVFELILKNLQQAAKSPLHTIMDTIESWGALIQKFIKDKEDRRLLLSSLFVSFRPYSRKNARQNQHLAST